MYRAVGAMCLLMATTVAAAQQSTLTEETAIQLGLTRDPVQQRTEGTLAKAQSDVISAKTWSNPKFFYERETLNNGESLVEQKFVFLQKFDFSGRRGLRKQAADRHFAAAQYENDAWRVDLTKEIRERYYHALFQQARQQKYEATQQRIRLLNAVLKKRRTEGDVSVYDYQRVSTERAAIEAKVSDAAVDFHTAWQKLWALLGSDNQGYTALQGELLPAPALPLEKLQAQLDSRPGLRRLKEQIEGYTLQHRAENRTFPDITFALGYKREDTNQQSANGVVFNALIPLPVLDKQKDKQARFHAQTLHAQSEYRMAYDAAQSELKVLWEQTTQYQRNAARYRRDAVQATNKLIVIAETYYRAGEVGILELLDAYRSALNAELTSLDMEFKARSARINLDSLTGGPDQ